MTRTFQQGRLIREASWDADGRLAASPRIRYARAEYVLDDKGRRTEETYFDPDGHLISQDDAFYMGVRPRVVRSFGPGNEMTETTFVNEADIPLNQGCAEVRISYGNRGQLLENECLGVDGKPLTSRFGHARAVYRYGSDGFQTGTVFYDQSGKIVDATLVITRVNQEVAQLGLQGGDIVVSLNGFPVHDYGELNYRLSQAFRAPRELKILRAGKVLSVMLPTPAPPLNAQSVAADLAEPIAHEYVAR